MHSPAWQQAAMGLREEDQPPPQQPALATPADGVVLARTPRTQGCAVNAGTQTLNQLRGHAQDALRIVCEGMLTTPSSQENVVSLKSDNEGQDRGALEELDHLNLAAYLSTRSRPPGLP